MIYHARIEVDEKIPLEVLEEHLQACTTTLLYRLAPVTVTVTTPPKETPDA